MVQVLVECAISFVDQVVLSPAANVDQQTDKLTKSQKMNRRRKLRIKRQKDQELLEKKQGKIVTDSTTSKKRKRNQRANKTCVGDGLNAKLEVVIGETVPGKTVATPKKKKRNKKKNKVAGDVLSAKEEGSSATQVPEAVSGEMVLAKTALRDVKMVSKEEEHTQAVNGKIETANLNVKGAVDSTLTIGEILIPQSLQNLKADNGETGPGSTAADTTASKKRERTKKKKKSPLSGDILSTCENLEDKVNAIDGLSTTKVLDTKVTNKTELNDITNHNVDGKKGPEVVTSEIGASNRTSKQKTKKQKVGVNHSENKNKTKPTLGKKLVIFDVNGILADIVYPCPRCYEADYYHGRKAVFKRPCLGDFVAFCFEKFNVGIWSSRPKNNLDPVVHDLLGDLKKKLLFTWDASHCTKSWMFTLENPRKLIAFKELRKIWGKSCRLWVKGTFNESNTLLVDDSPYKALLNPKHTGIFPTSYKYTDTNDDFLGPTGALRAYLEGFAAADDGRTYVEQNPFGQGPIDETNRDWIFYSRVLKVHQNEENLNEKENDKLKVDVNPSEKKKITKLTLGKKLVIFDVNGILADIVYPLPTNYEADYYNGDEAVFKRPYLGDFLAFCFEKFNVGIWSSRPKKKLDRVVHDLFGDLEKKLLFTWDASHHCIESWRLTLENRCERIFFKELRKIWEKSCRLWVKGTFNESNTLLVDDSPYKALLNPKHTGIFPTSYKYTDMNDDFLGPTGALRAYLEGFAAADDGMTYVEQNPFGQGPIDETTQDWKYCSHVLKGQKQYCNVAEVRNEENLNEKESDIQNVNIKEVNEKEGNDKVNKNHENDDATQNEKEEKIEKDIEVGNENEGKKKPSRFLVSPYINKKTATTGQAQPDEVMVTDSLFSMEGNPCDFVFETKKGDATLRDTMQTLAPQLDVSSNVIDSFVAVLNYEEMANTKDMKKKHFFHTVMITKDMFEWKKEDGEPDEERQYAVFSESIKSEFDDDASLIKMKDLEMAFFPIIAHGHFYLVVFNLLKGSSVIIDNSKSQQKYGTKYKTECDLLREVFSRHLAEQLHPRAEDVSIKKPTILRPKWGTKNNDTDCGVFLMMHMEHYNGETANKWNLEFPTEGERQNAEIKQMRIKFATKILTHDINIHREKISEEAHEFAEQHTDMILKEELIMKAINKRKQEQASERVPSAI